MVGIVNMFINVINLIKDFNNNLVLFLNRYIAKICSLNTFKCTLLLNIY